MRGSSELQAGVPEYLRNDPSMSGPVTRSGAWQNWWEETGSQPPVRPDAPNAFPLRSVPGPAPRPAPPASPAPPSRGRRGRRDEAELSFDDLRAPEEPRGSRVDSSTGTYSRLRPPPDYERPAYPRPDPSASSPGLGRPDPLGAPPRSRRPDDSGRLDPSASSPGLGRPDPSASSPRLRRPDDGGRLDPLGSAPRSRRPDDSGRLDPSASSPGRGRLDPGASSRLRRPDDGGRMDPAASSPGIGRLDPGASSSRLRRPDDGGRMDPLGSAPRSRRPDDSGRLDPAASSPGLGRLDPLGAPPRSRRADDSGPVGPRRAGVDSGGGAYGRLADSSAGLDRLAPDRRRPSDSSAGLGRLGAEAPAGRGRRRAEDGRELGSIDGGRRARRGGATRADLVEGSTALAPPERVPDEVTDTGARRARSTFKVAEEPEAYDEPSLILQWGVFLLQTLTAAAAGLGVWLGFYRLWSTWPFYAAPAVGVTLVGMLAVARLLRRRYGHELDLLTAVVTVAVGTVLTVLPAAFTLQSIA